MISKNDGSERPHISKTPTTEADEPSFPHQTTGTFDLVASADEAAQRLDKVLSQRIEHVSRSRLKEMILAGHVTIDGRPTRDPNAKLQPGDHLRLEIPEARPAEPDAQPIPLAVVYEDEHLIVIDKPAGLVVHPAGGHEDGTLVNALLSHCGDSLSGIGGVKRPGIVHRLDKDTSGLLVVAKNDHAHRRLAAQFADHGRTGPLVRAYLAFVWGKPNRPNGTIEANLERSHHNREKIVIVQGERGREAITHFSIVESYAGIAEPPARREDLVSLVECRLETGRTHQIRVHMASIGHPLLGDRLYGSGFKTKALHLDPDSKAALDALGNRQALHAALLGFEHPVSRKELVFESELPPDLLKLRGALGKSSVGRHS